MPRCFPSPTSNMAQPDDDDAVVQRLPTALGYPNDCFRKQITAVLTKTRNSIINKGDDLQQWIEENITVSNAQMADLYASLLLEAFEKEYKQMVFVELPKAGLEVNHVLPNPHMVNKFKRYGETLFDYKARIRELAMEIAVVRNGTSIVQEAIAKAEFEKTLQDAKKNGLW